MAKDFPFDPGFFDTKIRLGNGLLAQRILNGFMGSTTLEDTRDYILWALPRYRKRLQYLVARNKALAASILEVSGKTVFFDASKFAESIRHFSHEQDLDFRVVHLVRDVRGFSLSRHRNKGETDLRLIVNKWIHANSNIERQLQRLPTNRWIRIRYEDVCNSPLETLNRFYAFCGLAPVDATAAIHPAEHHIVGNRMRLTSFEGVRVDEAWRRTFTPDQQAYIARLAGKMHAQYGYKPMDNLDLVRESK